MSPDYPNIPFKPKRWPFFYGWFILAAATVGTLASIPGQTMGVGVFTDPLLEALHLSRTQLSSAYAFGTIASSFVLPLAGSLLDRWGARAMGVFSAVGVGVAMLMLAGSDMLLDAAGIRAAWFAMSIAFVCFFALRFFGQGCLTMCSRVMIGKWFNHRRGIAAALSTVFVSFGFNGSPQLINDLLTIYGWRGAALWLAMAVGGVMSVLALIFYRDNPEECGLAMDGVDDPAWHKKMSERVADIKVEFTRRMALKTAAFWAFTGALATQGLIVTALTFHVASMGEEMGLTREQAFEIFLPMAAFSVVSTLIGGWASDRTRMKYLLFVMMFSQGVGTIGLLDFGNPLGLALLTAGYGTAGGLFATLVTVAWPRFYGRKHLGAISGINMSAMVFASALGPVFFSTLRGWTGSYREAILISLAMPVAVLILGLFADNPQDRVEAEGEA